MDPISASGIGLAITSLLSQCFAGAMQAIHLILDARNLESDYDYLKLRLCLERQRLYNWSSEAGLLKYLENQQNEPNRTLLGLSRTTVLNTFISIQVLACEFITAQGRYGCLIPNEDNSGSALQSHSGNTEVYDMHETRFLKEARHIMHRSLGLPKRLKWSIFHKDRFETFIHRFAELNDALIDLVGSDARVAIRQSTRETNVTILHVHNRIEELVTLIKALLPEENDRPWQFQQNRSECRESSDLQQKQDLAGLAYVKAVKTTLDGEVYFNLDNPPTTGTEIPDLKLLRSDVHIITTAYSTSDRCEAEYHPVGMPSQRVWIEWREYDFTAHQEIIQNRITPIRHHPPRAPQSIIPTRIDKLVAMLNDPHKPHSLRVPRCLGYFDDSTDAYLPGGTLGFVLSRPCATAISPISLRQLIETQSKPLLTKRINLAKAIASCLMSLHSVNWLYKGLRSHNIVFFPEDVNAVNYSEPYLSGFGYARPVYREDMTESPSQNPIHDMYRHPSTHGLGPHEGRLGFKRTFDIYALGVVLLEIAQWECIERVLAIDDQMAADKATLASIQRRLVKEEQYMDSVGANAGLLYQDATRTCLMGAAAFDVGSLDDEMDSHIAAKLSTNFSQKVLRPLERIST